MSEYSREYARNHYLANKAYYIAKAIRHNRRVSAEARRIILEYLLIHPCVDCGETDPIVLDFDHKTEPVKLFIIADAPRRSISVKSLLTEIAKCEIRCANCH